MAVRNNDRCQLSSMHHACVDVNMDEPFLPLGTAALMK